MELPTDASSPMPLPPPPPPPPAPVTLPQPAAAQQRPSRQPAPGELTTGWRVATALVWAGAFVAMIAVWKTSTELGMTTWWLGPLGDPMPAVVRMVPYVPPTVMVVLALNNLRFVPYAGIAASVALAAIGAADLGRVPRLALVELAIALAGLLISIAGFSGRYRPAHPTHPRVEARPSVGGPDGGPPTLG